MKKLPQRAIQELRLKFINQQDLMGRSTIQFPTNFAANSLKIKKMSTNSTSKRRKKYKCHSRLK